MKVEAHGQSRCFERDRHSSKITLLNQNWPHLFELRGSASLFELSVPQSLVTVNIVVNVLQLLHADL